MQPIDLRSRWRAGGLALVLVAAACGQGDGDGDGEVEGRAAQALGAPAGAGAGSTVTLISGDRVTLRKLAGQVTPHVQKGPGRSGVAVSVHRQGASIYVMPTDMAELVAAGALDRELFNVTRLVAEGYSDEEKKETPLLITGLVAGGASRAGFWQASGPLAQGGLSVRRTLPSLGMAAVLQPKQLGAAALAPLLALGKAQGAAAGAAPPMKIWLDVRQRTLLDRSVPQIGAAAAYARGLTGAGVKIAVIDTGVDASHPDFAGRVAQAVTFVADGRGPEDVHGHGTHVASIAAGSGAASDGRLHGVAPGATILSGRVCNQYGECLTSDVLAGMEWAAEQGAQIVNLSLGSTGTEEIDPLEEAVNRLSTERGVLFVTAAGNEGGPRTVRTPATAEAALAVGAVDAADQLASFSSRGPGSAAQPLKPEITAPGVTIVAARAAGTSTGQPVDERYTRFSGTSMATPHVVGAAALLLQQHPSWTGAQLKAALMGSAAPQANSVYEQGAGRVDLARATEQLMRAQPASLSFGFAEYPHDDDPVLTQTVRYQNDSAQAVTLHVVGKLRDESGQDAPAGLISVSPATVDVPAGGSAEVSVTMDTREAPPSLYGGSLVAVGSDGSRVITPVGVESETEGYDLKMHAIGRDGEPVYYTMGIIRVAQDGQPAEEMEWWQRVEGTRTFHLPRGKYLAYGHSLPGGVLVFAPRIDVEADTTLDLDARLGKEVAVQVPDPEAALDMTTLEYRDTGADFSYGIEVHGEMFALAQLGPNAPAGEVSTSISVDYTKDGDGTAAKPDVAYYAARFFPDIYPNGWSQTFAARDFAQVHASYQVPAGRMLWMGTAAAPPGTSSPTYFEKRFSTGRSYRTEYFHGDDYLWIRSGYEYSTDPDNWVSFVNEEALAYPLGAPITEKWYQAPFGPGFYTFSVNSLMLGFDGSPRRSGSYIRMEPTLLAGASRNASNSYSDLVSNSTRLLRNGKPFATSLDPWNFAVATQIPAERARYRYEAELERDPSLFELSTKVKAAWSFDAQAGTDRQDLPLPTLRFSPQLDEQNRATSPLLLLPIHISRPPRAAAPRIADAKVEVSFDEGAHWHRLPILRVGDQAVGLVAHPRGAKYVSLRGSARDVEGHEGEVTIIRAYALK